MKRYISILGVVLIISLGCVVSCRRAGTWLVKRDDLVKADAIIMLMGSIADRVLEVADLYLNEEIADRVIIVNESMGPFRDLEERGAHIISNSDQVHDAFVALGIPNDSIIVLPGDATSTQMEAMIIRDYLKLNPTIDTLILVSSSEHMRRAAMIFKAAMRKEETMLILSCPSSYTNFNAKAWWKDKEGMQRVLPEYVKIVNFLLFERRKLKQ